jgi:hypothetical protein
LKLTKLWMIKIIVLFRIIGFSISRSFLAKLQLPKKIKDRLNGFQAAKIFLNIA